MKKLLTASAVAGTLAAVFLLGSCANELGRIVESSDANLESAADSNGRYVVNWGDWEPLDYFNSSKWNMANWTNGGMFNCGFKSDHISFSNGQMTIRLDGTPSYGRPYTSGEYRTNNTYTYGTFETNMIAAKGSGLVTSFFLYTGNPWDEIDVEILGKDTTKVQFNYYVDGVANNEKVIDLGFDASQGFHKYAIEYGNGYINWYVDGKWRYGVNNTGMNAPYGKKMPSHPMQIMVNLWPGTGVDSWLGHYWHSGNKYAKYDYIKYTPK